MYLENTNNKQIEENTESKQTDKPSASEQATPVKLAKNEIVVKSITNKFISHQSMMKVFILAVERRWAQGGRLVIEGAAIDVNGDTIYFDATGKVAQSNASLLKRNTGVTILNLAVDEISPPWRPFNSKYKLSLLDSTRIIPIANTDQFNKKNPFSISQISDLYTEEGIGPINIIAKIINIERQQATPSIQAREKITLFDESGSVSVYAYSYNMLTPKKIGEVILICGIRWTELQTDVVIRGFIIKDISYSGYKNITKTLQTQEVNKNDLIQRGPKLRKMILSDVEEAMLNIENEGMIFEVDAKISDFEDFETKSDIPKYRLLLKIQDNYRTVRAQAWGGGGGAESIMGYNYKALKILRDENNAKFQNLIQNIMTKDFTFQIALRRFRNELQINILRGRSQINLTDDFEMLIL